MADPSSFTELGLPEKSKYGNIDCDRSNAGSSLYAYFNIVCAVCGIGMLGLPQALSRGGWAALALLLFAWWMATYCSIILIKCLYSPRNQETRLSSFTAVAEDAFGKVGGWVLFFFQAWIVLGGPILFFVLCGTSMNELCRGTAGEIGVVPWIIVFCVVVAIPFIFFKSMKDMGWTSIFGAVAIIVITVICIVMAGIDSPNVTQYVTHNNIIWEGYPIALSTIALSCGANVLYPSIEASMKKPQDWSYTIATALTTCVLLYIMVAVAGYYVYGDTIFNPMYYSIPNGVPRIFCITLMVINTTVSAPIYLMSFTIECEEMMNITIERWGPTGEFMMRAGFRTLTVMFCGIIGCVVPFFDNLMSLFGALGFCSTTFIFPVLCYWRLTGFRNKPIYELAWNFLIIMFGTMGMIFGSWFSVQDLIAAFQNNA
ncbi:transmembrane amino acid transporter protein-domain-containing protein [Phascolomyces articulosus]|uniref:Transmembrane amino acid transporter protein-domain-containing protein n=1 Tax=Phascolomyces articulosus TaxID=60185 RepID=A0AAD5K5P9_9FUNG|nr:transmembrane amino acid transporter protein-domain-containing protein [Phascolomyces articulosus]